MAIDTYLLERIDRILDDKKVVRKTIKMMGGMCYMIDDKMCFGSVKDGLMLRVDPAGIPTLLNREGADQMMHGRNPMKSFIWVAPTGYDFDEDLEFWIDQCLAFNPKAKSSKKR